MSLRLFRHHIRLAETVAELVRKDARFELSAPPRFGLVCFHLKVRPLPHPYIPAQSSHRIQPNCTYRSSLCMKQTPVPGPMLLMSCSSAIPVWSLPSNCCCLPDCACSPGVQGQHCLQSAMAALQRPKLALLVGVSKASPCQKQALSTFSP